MAKNTTISSPDTFVSVHIVSMLFLMQQFTSVVKESAFPLITCSHFRETGNVLIDRVEHHVMRSEVRDVELELSQAFVLSARQRMLCGAHMVDLFHDRGCSSPPLSSSFVGAYRIQKFHLYLLLRVLPCLTSLVEIESIHKKDNGNHNAIQLSCGALVLRLGLWHNPCASLQGCHLRCLPWFRMLLVLKDAEGCDSLVFGQCGLYKILQNKDDALGLVSVLSLSPM